MILLLLYIMKKLYYRYSFNKIRKMKKKKSTMNCMVGSMAHDIVFTNSICNDVLTKR